MKKIVLILLVLALANVAFAAETVNVPGGITGLWRFQTARIN